MPRSLYCPYEVFVKIRDSPEKHAPFHDLILAHNHIVFDLTEEEYRLKQQATLTSFTRETDITTDTVPGFLEYLPFPVRQGAGSALFILEEEQQAHIKNLRNYGVCVVILEQPESLAILQNNFYWQLEKPNSFGSSDAVNWQQIVARAGQMPLNALVLVDNYLLGNATKATDRGMVNILDILSGLMPTKQNSALPFQILLVASHKGGLYLKADELAQIQEKLNTTRSLLLDTLKRRVSYKVEVDILLHSNANSDFHRRAIISNYHFLRFDHGLDAFDRDKVRFHNDISVEGAFRNLGNPKCHTPWKSMALELQSIKRTLALNAGVLKSGSCDNRLLELVSSLSATKNPYNPYQREQGQRTVVDLSTTLP